MKRAGGVVLLLSLLALACSGKDGGEQAGGAGASGSGSSSGSGGSAGTPPVAIGGRGGSGAGSGGGGEVDPVSGLEPVDTAFGGNQRGCRADAQCEDRPLCDTCIAQWACVAPGGTRPGGCGTACCGGVGPNCFQPPQVVPPAPPCMDDSGCLSPAAAHCAQGRCVPCTESAHCLVPGKPVCSENACVECATDVDCTAFPSRPLCIATACVQCEDDSQCSGATPYCVTNFCRACTQDTHCTAQAPRCVASACRQCTATADCAQGVCVANACEPECTRDEECARPAQPRYCSADTQRCEWIPCSTDAECDAAYVCSQGYCAVASCERDADCPEGAPYCVQQGCHPVLGTCHSRFSP